MSACCPACLETCKSLFSSAVQPVVATATTSLGPRTETDNFHIPNQASQQPELALLT
jgi:hypothetical protein